METDMTITHPELVVALVKPGSDIASFITPQEADLWHGATGVAGEAAEILEATRCAVVDFENMFEELGDMEFYLEQVRQNLGIDRIYTVEEGLHFAGSLEAAAIQLAIWSGHLLDRAKKVAIYKKTADASAFVDILSEIEFVMAALRTECGFTREQTLAGNIKKLSVRYAGLTYTDADAQARADKQEG
jgi:hypothetical protein